MTNEPLSKQEAYEIGVEAYVYFYPLVLMDVTRRVSTNVEAGVMPGFGPMNEFHHFRAFPTAEFRAVVRPNFDTLYSSAWLDLTNEPMVISAPDTDRRYYMLPMLDMWTDVFAVPGKRTSGTNAQSFAVVPRRWDGTAPEEAQVIESPTPFVWIIGRTQTNGPTDYEAVHKMQDGFVVTPLSQWGTTPKPRTAVIDASVDTKTPPMMQVNTMSAASFFTYGAELLQHNPPHITDWSIVARLKRIGIETGTAFDFNDASPTTTKGLERAVVDAQKLMRDKMPNLGPIVNGWQVITDTIGVYGNNYLKRASIAMAGLGANPPEDAIYPVNVGDADGQPLDGANHYVLHFPREGLPPVDAFWSVTLYDEQGFQVANELDRFAIGDRDTLRYNPDGSLDIYIQHESPGADNESNWLPSPASGRLGVTMRLYGPSASALDGRWEPPAIKKSNRRNLKNTI